MPRIRLMVGGALAAAVLTLGSGLASGAAPVSADAGGVKPLNSGDCVSFVASTKQPFTFFIYAATPREFTELSAPNNRGQDRGNAGQVPISCSGFAQGN